MSPSASQLALEHTVSNSGGLTRVSGLHEDNLPRDLGLRIRQEDSGKWLLFPYGDRWGYFPAPQTWDCEPPLTPVTLFGYVQACRRVWQQTIVDNQETVSQPPLGLRNVFPFQEEWDHKQRPPEWDRAIGARLAKAGDRLFFNVFERDADATQLELARGLRRASRERPLALTITSDACFVPWGMIYTHPDPDSPLAPDGSNFAWEGFWGFRHIVEHNTKYVGSETELKADSAGLIATSINFDERIDSDLKVDCIKSQLEFFRSLNVIDSRERDEKGELAKAFTQGEFSDRIVYFCCHGIGAGQPDSLNLTDARLTLTDGEEITADDIADWLRQRELESRPMVFINACQGGQMTTLFYQTLATELLKRKAVGLIGAQIDVPAVFAAEYAQRFFRAFLGKDSGRVRAGPLIRSLAQEFITNHQNPLGLIYSLYRGADCFVAW